MYRLLILLFFLTLLYPQTIQKQITGKIIDGETKLPLSGVNIYLVKLQKGTVSDDKGNYIIPNVESGNYIINYSFIGYKKVTQTDVIVKSSNQTIVNVSMFPDALELGEVVVNSGYFSKTESKPLSNLNFSSEEIRRSPGSAGDVSRILFILPSVAKINDSKNSLIVRGGSAFENSYYIDNIEIPNINHFPTQGASDGPIGLLNVDFIEDVNFYSGGFSSLYGDKLSSVMEIKYSDGNNVFTPKIGLNMAGMYFSAQGPILKGKSSYAFSANKSWLDLIIKNVDDAEIIPEYWDAQAKVVFNITDKSKISVFNIFSNDRIDQKYSTATDKGIFVYGNAKILSHTGGLNYQHIWGTTSYSNFAVSNSFTKYDYIFNKTKTKELLLQNKSEENTTNVRNSNFIKFSDKHKLEFGEEFKLTNNNYEVNFGNYTDEFGTEFKSKVVNKTYSDLRVGVYANYTTRFFNKFVLTSGFRGDFYKNNKKFYISPRFSIMYEFNEKTNISLFGGLFYQGLPAVILAQNEKFRSIDVMKSAHYILSFSHLITPETKLTIELFDKEYTNLPIDPSQPYLLLVDETMKSANQILEHSAVVSGGKAFTRGIELVVQKKLAEKLYGMISASYSVSKYTDLTGKERNRNYDNRFNFSVEGGYKPNDSWEFSLRWLYAGGRPITPVNEVLSTQKNQLVLFENKVNGDRLPDYHSLNIRADKRFNFDNSNLIVYLSISNIYGRDNIYGYEWDENKNKKSDAIMWKTMPILGIDFEF